MLVAPPGAGKTTRVPLVLAEELWAKGKRIMVLEPRRIAARAAAARMAATLGEQVGETVGYRVRFGSKVTRATRIEVVTEGVFTRMVLDNPELDGIAALLFDEFHERSLDADLGLALARDVQQGLRDDLKLLVMSATLDGARVAALLGDAPVVESEGRAFPVETRYLGRDPQAPIERQVADAAARALRADAGSLLVFLPGAAEIRRTETLLRERVNDSTVDIVPLYGALDADVQDRAISPAPPGRRKVVLATSIAETSLTIDGVRVVIDSGLARVPRYEPDVGLTRLETVRVSRAAADQRRGRAGRTEPGICYRLWDEPQTASLAAANVPEILAADLSGFVLDLAHWGVADPATLAFLDPPPPAAIKEAKALLVEPWRDRSRRSHHRAGQGACANCRCRRGSRAWWSRAPPPATRCSPPRSRSCITERGLGGNDVDLTHRLDGLHRDRSRRAQEARAMAKRWADVAAAAREPRALSSAEVTPGVLLALAYPDRVAKNRGAGGSFLLANGRGANVDEVSALAREPFLVVAEIAGRAAQGRVLLAAPISLADIQGILSDRIESREDITFDAASVSLRGRRRQRLGAIALSEQPIRIEPSDETAQLLAREIARIGLDRLPWTKSLAQWRDRVAFLHQVEGAEWPDVSDAALAATASQWLAPAFAGKISLAGLGADELTAALHALLPWNLRRRLDDEAPTHFVAPTGSAVPIDYAAPEGPKISIRVQELFGLDRHPSIAGGRVPLVVELLSPAHRPVQVTRDLPGFWRGSYAAVKSRDERPLSAPSVAGQSAGRRAHAPRQAARRMIKV